MSETIELPLFSSVGDSRSSSFQGNVDWFVEFLAGKDWITAAEILADCGRPVTENEKRKLRAWADLSGGRICGHQKGYKLVTSMTHEEYQWWRNEALKASDAIRSRVLESDKVFYGKVAAR